MAKSRTVLLAAAAAAGAPAFAEPPTAAEGAIVAQRAMVTGAVSPRCPDGSEEGAIVVCARRDDNRHRLPLPIEAASGPGDRAGGEQMTALEAGQERCTTVGPNQQCSGGLPVFAVIAKLIEGMRNLSERGDE